MYRRKDFLRKVSLTLKLFSFPDLSGYLEKYRNRIGFVEKRYATKGRLRMLKNYKSDFCAY